MSDIADLTTREAAARKGVGLAAVSAAIRDGRLPARVERREGHARGTYRIRAEDLDAWEPLTDPSEHAAHAARQRHSAREAT